MATNKQHTDLIREQGEEIIKLVERLDHFKRDLDRFEKNSIEASKTDQELDKGLAITKKDVEHLEKRLDDLHTRRWETWKIILTVVISVILSNGVGFVMKFVERNAQIDPIRDQH